MKSTAAVDFIVIKALVLCSWLAVHLALEREWLGIESRMVDSRGAVFFGVRSIVEVKSVLEDRRCVNARRERCVYIEIQTMRRAMQMWVGIEKRGEENANLRQP